MAWDLFGRRIGEEEQSCMTVRPVLVSVMGDDELWLRIAVITLALCCLISGLVSVFIYVC